MTKPARLLHIPLFLAILALLSLGLGAPARAEVRLLLPPGLAVGAISGPGGEDVARALKKYQAGGETRGLLGGRLSLTRGLTAERETVPVEKEAGPPHPVYEADPFTQRLWPTEEFPMVTDVENFDLERFTGHLVFDWQVTPLSGGAASESGRAVLDMDRTRGGFLAELGLTEPLAQTTSNLEATGRERLAGELVAQLLLTLGRHPAPSEIESGQDSLSPQAKRLAAAGDWESAKTLWLDLLKQNPDYPPPLYNLGLYWEFRKNPEEAWRYYRLAFRADATPRHREALTRLTDTLARAGRRPDRQSAEE